VPLGTGLARKWKMTIEMAVAVLMLESWCKGIDISFL